MSDAELLPYLRQLRHNDGSDGFVFAYETEGVDRLVAMLRAQVAAQPVAVFDGYIDGAAVIQWRGKALPAGTVLYAEPVAK